MSERQRKSELGCAHLPGMEPEPPAMRLDKQVEPLAELLARWVEA